jgi:hypothetical protein
VPSHPGFLFRSFRTFKGPAGVAFAWPPATPCPAGRVHVPHCTIGLLFLIHELGLHYRPASCVMCHMLDDLGEWIEQRDLKCVGSHFVPVACQMGWPGPLIPELELPCEEILMTKV